MHPIHSLSRALPAMLAMGLAASLPGQARALTLDHLKGAQLEGIYGIYAPRGDCTREPRITVDDSGLAYTLGGKATHSGKVEYAVSYGGQDYAGISQWIFPFPVSDDDFGRVLMTFNADEKAGKLLVEPDLGPGQGLGALQAALVEASPFARCAKGK